MHADECDDILVWAGELRPCLKVSSIWEGKVCPFSQMSSSFLIFSYTDKDGEFLYLKTRTMQRNWMGSFMSNLGCRAAGAHATLPYETFNCILYAYLLVLRGRLTNVIHQYGHQLGYSVNASGIRAIRGGTVNGLALCLGLFKPFSGY